MEKVYTIEEISTHLRVPETAVREEIASGRLRAFNLGGHTRVPDSAMIEYMAGNSTGRIKSTHKGRTNLSPTSDFTYTWPNKHKEEFTEAHEGIVSNGDTKLRVKLGFTLRGSAGVRRRRSLIIVNRYPTVEFVSADDTPDGKMASVIRDRQGKQVQVGATLPPE